MEPELTTIAQSAPGRLLVLAPNGAIQLVWDNATIRLPIFELAHLAAVLDAWCADEEPPLIRRGYYRLLHSPTGGVQLWLNTTGLLLSREDLRALASLIAAASAEVASPLCRQQRTPFGLGYRRLGPASHGADRHN